MKKRKILEVGPGVHPMHHRRNTPEDGLILRENEEYVALDQPQAVVMAQENELWKRAIEKYGDRVEIVSGDRSDMEGVADGSIDELISLGSHVKQGRVVGEFNRVLASGGVLRLGAPVAMVSDIKRSWGVRLKNLGFTELEEDYMEYDYSSRPDIPQATVEYAVVSFRKGN